MSDCLAENESCTATPQQEKLVSGKSAMGAMALAVAMQMVVLMGSSTGAQEVPPLEKPPAKKQSEAEKKLTDEQLGQVYGKVQKLIAGLGDEQFRNRVKADRELSKLSDLPSMIFLQSAIGHKDLEISKRAEQIVEDKLPALVAKYYPLLVEFDPKQPPSTWVDGMLFQKDPKQKRAGNIAKRLPLPKGFSAAKLSNGDIISEYRQKAKNRGVPFGSSKNEWPNYGAASMVLDEELRDYAASTAFSDKGTKKEFSELQKKEFPNQQQRNIALGMFLMNRFHAHMQASRVRRLAVQQMLWKGSDNYRIDNNMPKRMPRRWMLPAEPGLDFQEPMPSPFRHAPETSMSIISPDRFRSAQMQREMKREEYRTVMAGLRETG